MTERLYYEDSYLTSFTARAAAVDQGGRKLYLDRTAFYPTSGGQPNDLGTISGIPLEDVVDEGGRIAHLLSAPLPRSDGVLPCEIDAGRRFDHMQQHTGQHLISAVLFEAYGAETLSFHLGLEVCTIELSIAALEPRQMAEAEERANRIVAENRPVRISFEDASAVQGLRKASERTGTLRIISIDGLDRSACGGTHVRSTGEIGCILLRGTERIRGNVRLEFVCGLRGVRRARADYQALTDVARQFSSPLDDVPKVVAAQISRLNDAEKTRKKLTAEVAAFRGRQLHAETAPDARGMRPHFREVPELTDEARTEAQAFTAGGRAVFVAWAPGPGAVLIAASSDSGINAGSVLKPLLAQFGGRGGGSTQIAQGSVPGRENLEKLVAALRLAVEGAAQ